MFEPVEFFSEGARLRGHLYLPPGRDAGARHPAVVLCHGFGGVKELLLPAFARRFAERGYAALAFDYRGFGESEGVRGKLSPALQVADIRNALTFVRARPEVDPARVALWGSSYGGANAITVAAVDRRVRCLVVQLTFGDGERVVTRGLSAEEREKLLAGLERMWARAVLEDKVLAVPLEKVLTDPQSKAFYHRYVGEFPALRTKIPLLTTQETLEHKPELLLDRVRVPILIVAAEDDQVNPREESERLFARAREPRELYVVPGATHYDVYEGAPFEAAAAREVAWLDRHLGPAGAAPAADLR